LITNLLYYISPCKHSAVYKVYLDFTISSLEIVHTEIKVSPIVHNTDIPDSVITYLLFWNILAD